MRLQLEESCVSWVKGVPLQSGFMFISDSVPTDIIVMFFSDSLHIAPQLLPWHTFFLRGSRKYFSYYRVKQTSLICVSAVWQLFFSCSSSLKMQSLENLNCLWESQSQLSVIGVRDISYCMQVQKLSAQIIEADSCPQGSCRFQFSFLFLYLSISISFPVDSAVLLN